MYLYVCHNSSQIVIITIHNSDNNSMLRVINIIKAPHYKNTVGVYVSLRL